MEYLMNGLEFIALMIFWALLTIAIFCFFGSVPYHINEMCRQGKGEIKC